MSCVIIGSCKGLSGNTRPEPMPACPLDPYKHILVQNSIKIQTFSFNKFNLKVSSTKCWPSFSWFIVLTIKSMKERSITNPGLATRWCIPSYQLKSISWLPTWTLSQSTCTALTAGMPAVRAVHGDCHWGLKNTGNSHWSCDPIMQWGTRQIPICI